MFVKKIYNLYRLSLLGYHF